MDSKQELKLIDGTFLPNEAIEILLNLYNQKIKFHELKNFSTQECTGTAHSYSVQRIPELEVDIETIKKIIKDAAEKNQKLIIKSILHIDFVQN
ncbi:hypothetical protein [Flavobacterium ovatum]|uniref:hypothetical protein n=1 Tax=Flavobacterium ovatum TaxID=1928857 RepID=UPI00344C5E35